MKQSDPAQTNTRMAEILDSAAHFFYTQGYHATSIDDVAHHVGILKGSLYYYIKSKEDLLYELLVEVMTTGKAGVDQALVGATNPFEKLEKGLGQHIEHIIDKQVRVGLFLHEFDSLSGRRRQHVQQLLKDYQKIFTGIVREGQAAGTFMSGNPTLLVNGMLGMCNWIYRWYHTEDSPKLDEVKKTFLSLIMRGVVKHAN